MESIAEILQLRGLRDVLIPSEVARKPETRVLSEEELAAAQGKFEPQRPAWAVGACSICAAFLGRGQYRRPKGAKGIACKRGECANLYAAISRRSKD